MQATRFERPGAYGRVGQNKGLRGHTVGALLPHDKICFVYVTATATHLQNPTVSHHRACLQRQLEGGCLATENKAGFHCKGHTSAQKSLLTAADPRNLKADLAGQKEPWEEGGRHRIAETQPGLFLWGEKKGTGWGWEWGVKQNNKKSLEYI